jgi:hypothetical protein
LPQRLPPPLPLIRRVLKRMLAGNGPGRMGVPHSTGADALEEVNWLICEALDHRDKGRALLMVRIRLAILVLQAPPQGPLH